MPELRSHKRGRSLDQRLSSKSEHRFITASGEVEAQATTSDSEYDSDVIVVGKGRKCPRVSRTPPNHMPSWMRTLPQPPTSPQSTSSTSLPEPALLEWHTGTSSQDPPCIHLGEITDLKARVGYLELEAQNNIELRSEMQQNWCRVSAEYRKLQQDLNRVSMECNELRQTVRDLVQFRRWEELRRQGEEDDRRDLENLVNSRAVAAEQRVREQIRQLRADLEHERLTPLGDKSTHIETETTPSPVPMDIEKPTIEEFLEIIEPNGGLNESRHAPGTSQGTVPSDKPRDPPAGPKEWRDKLAKRQRRSRRSGNTKRNPRKETSKLEQLEAEISELKDKIKEKEKAKEIPHKCSGPQDNANKWTVVNRHRSAEQNSKTETLRIRGKYKLIIRSADDGTRLDVDNIQNEIRSERRNRVLLSQQATDSNYAFEYKNRRLLSHNHRGGITFTVDTPQEAARCMNLGIVLSGRKHRVFAYTRSRADDLCSNCSAWGHLERNCTDTPRCGTCSEGHRTDRHPDIRKGKNKFRCPNCGGNHQVTHGSCLARVIACEKQENRSEGASENAKGQQSTTQKEGKNRRTQKKRGAPRSAGPGRQ
jgi:hypothetical protein